MIFPAHLVTQLYNEIDGVFNTKLKAHIYYPGSEQAEGPIKKDIINKMEWGSHMRQRYPDRKQPSNAHHVYVTTYNTAQVRHLQQITQYQYPDGSTKSFTENFKSRGRRTMKLKKASVFTRPRNLTQAERAEVQALAMEEENWTAHLESALAESGQPVDPDVEEVETRGQPTAEDEEDNKEDGEEAEEDEEAEEQEANEGAQPESSTAAEHAEYKIELDAKGRKVHCLN